MDTAMQREKEEKDHGKIMIRLKLTLQQFLNWWRFFDPCLKRYRDWPIYCCGTDTFICGNEEEQLIVIDMKDLFEEIDDDEWLEDFA